VFVEMPERYTFPFFLSGSICGEFDWLCHRGMVKLDTHGDLCNEGGKAAALARSSFTAASTGDGDA
jgi:hypothetical protein